MNWIRFDKQLPPEDTTVMVSNGPAMGHYHYKKVSHDNFCGPLENSPFSGMVIPLWTLDGVRVECKVADFTQWTLLLKSDVQREKLVTKRSLWKRIKSWINL